jgi:BirA family transcriptional regulator, biotin operon repressor / biotin---[acetyl-CoA-carboxylase] ligase
MEIIYHHFESLTSTNDWVKGHLKTIPQGSLLLVTAGGQTHARGQYGRRWVSPQGVNIYASFGFLMEDKHDPLALTHLLAISAARTLKERGVACQIKWPNDLLVNRKKIGGILCETERLSSHIGIAIGIGVNVNMSTELLQTVGQPATSLLAESGQMHDLQEILSSLRGHFAADLSLFLQKGFKPFLSTFRGLSVKSKVEGVHVGDYDESGVNLCLDNVLDGGKGGSNG